jgi:hypothetical protein
VARAVEQLDEADEARLWHHGGWASQLIQVFCGPTKLIAAGAGIRRFERSGGNAIKL